MSRSFNVAYTFLAKDAFTAVAKKIRGANKSLTDSFKGVDDSVDKSGKTFARTSSSMIGNLKQLAAAYLSWQAVSGVVRIGADFETAMADLSALTGAVGKDFDMLRERTLSMAKASVTSQADVAEGIKLVAGAKPELLTNINLLTKTTEQVLLLKNAARIDLAMAAKVTAESLNIFGKSAESTAEFVNILAAGAKFGSSEIADTGEAVLAVGSIASVVGLDFLQLNAAIQTVAKSGKKGAEAGTGLKMILLNMREAGIDFKELGLEGTFKALRVQLDSITNQTARAKVETKLFGKEHIAMALGIMNNTSLLGLLEKQMYGTSAAQEQADIQLNTLNKKWEKLGIVLKESVIRVFDKLGPKLGQIVDKMIVFFDTLDPKTISSIGDSLLMFVNTFAAIGSVVSGILTVLGPFLAVIKAIVTSLAELTAAFATMDFSKFTSLTEGLTINGKFLGWFDVDKPGAATMDTAGVAAPYSVGAPVSGATSSTTDINMNIMAPQGVVKSVQSRTTGDRNTNVGWNMVNG